MEKGELDQEVVLWFQVVTEVVTVLTVVVWQYSNGFHVGIKVDIGGAVGDDCGCGVDSIWRLRRYNRKEVNGEGKDGRRREGWRRGEGEGTC